MGGVGNTGTEPQGQATAAATGAPVQTPGWVAPAAPAAPATPVADAGTALRPYEQQTASTGGLVEPATTPAATAAPTTVANLGFPTGTNEPSTSNQVFDHTDFPTHAAPEPPTVAGPATPAPTTPTAPAPDPNAPSPSDWLFAGYLPTDFHAYQGTTFGQPWNYAPTGARYTTGYGSVGNFGGVKGHGDYTRGAGPVLPQLAAGAKLTGAQVDQYDRVSRADYDRYMGLYGVGYDLPAYQQALNGLVYQQNMQNYTPGGGG